MDSAHPSQMLKALSAQLGCDYSKLEKEGGRLWESLNNLHTSDPQGYTDFMCHQLKDMEASEEEGFLSDPEKLPDSMPPFVPHHGFVVKTFVRPNGMKLFVNICHHNTAAPKPFDADGKAVGETCQCLDNVQIPLIISKIRYCVDGSQTRAMVVDAVVNSWCIDMCQKKDSSLSEFKAQLVVFVLKWIEEEHSVKVQAQGRIPWKIIKSKYKGGFGKDGTKVRPFEHQIKHNGHGDSMHKSEAQKGNLGGMKMTESPSDLLKFRKEQKEMSETKEKDLNMKIPQIDKKRKEFCKPVLIQEIQSQQPTGYRTASNTSVSKIEARKKSVIKSGFLNQRENNSLYADNGSVGDGSSGTGGTYATLMSRCKVIDTADVNHESARSIANYTAEVAQCDTEFHNFCVDGGQLPDGTNNNKYAEITRTLSSISSVMACTTQPEPQKGVTSGDIKSVAVAKEAGDTIPKISTTCDDQDTTNMSGDIHGTDKDVKITLKEMQVTMEIDLSSCQPPIDKMSDMDLQMSEKLLKLKSLTSEKEWNIAFKNQVVVDSV